MFDPTTLLGFHTIVSLIALGTGILAVLALLGLRLPAVWTQLFLLTAVMTSATGFLFPVTAVLPSHIIGAIALVVSLYFLFFVAIAQAFGKVPVLKAAAPTQSEPPFAIAQGAALVIFIGLGIAALRLFRYRGAAVA